VAQSFLKKLDSDRYPLQWKKKKERKPVPLVLKKLFKFFLNFENNLIIIIIILVLP
jgi:hypothetical protein